MVKLKLKAQRTPYFKTITLFNNGGLVKCWSANSAIKTGEIT